MARIVIAGCGDVGSALGRRLLDAGHEVWGVRRNPSRLPEGLRPLAADLCDSAALDGLPRGIDRLVYSAAADGYTEAAYRAAYVTGVARVLDALRRHGERPDRVVLVSSTSVYGQQDGEWIDEQSPAEAEGFAPECLRTGERLVWAAPFPATVIRFGGIYGPGRTRLIDQVRGGGATCRPDLYTNRIHRDDCAGALVHLLSLEHPAPLYLGVDDEPAAQCEVLRWLAAQLGMPAPREVTEDGERRRRGNKRCRNTRLRDSGWRPRYPGYRDGYAALLAAEGAGVFSGE